MIALNPRLLPIGFVFALMLACTSPVPEWDTATLRWMADFGDEFAQFHLGLRYANGRGVAQDDAEAVKWYRKSAAQGDLGHSIRVLATVSTLAARLADWPAEDQRTLELLEATPRVRVRPDQWLNDFRRLGETVAHPDAAVRAERAPAAGDLALVSMPGKPPMFVLEVRGNKLELVDFTRPDAKLVILAERAEVLEPFMTEQRKKLA